MLRRTLVLSTMLVLALTMGCTASQRWMAIGAAGGAGIGAILGAHHAEAGCGALIGAASGAIAGGLVGSIIDYNTIKEKDARIAELEARNRDLEAQLAAARNELDAAKRRIAELEAELAKRGPTQLERISIAADVLFRPGSARLSQTGTQALNDAAGRIKSQFAGKFIMVEGHTDADPIRSSGWKSNWELGSARALTVLHYLEKQGIDPALLSAATFSKYQPVAGNDTREGKAQNRRAVIVIYSGWPKATK